MFLFLLFEKKNNFSDFRSSFLVYSHAAPMLRGVTRSQFLLLWSSLTIVVVGALVLHVEPFSRELTQESITIPCLLTLSKGYCFIFSASFLISCFFVTDPLYFQRKGLYIGQGTTMMSRSGMFRALEGVAVEMKNRVFNLPSLNGMFC